ncbi:MAG TPA: hypothetical protein VFF79_10480 [Conexibacter sp.]|jgi:hypothetical protein|nr:hypothetical protein [Conexibacter sp.]
MNQREERIVVETEHYRLTGTVRLPSEGYRSRLTDHLNAGEREFLALTDVEMVPLEHGERAASRHAYVALGRRHIVFATSAENGGGEPS